MFKWRSEANRQEEQTLKTFSPILAYAHAVFPLSWACLSTQNLQQRP